MNMSTHFRSELGRKCVKVRLSDEQRKHAEAAGIKRNKAQRKAQRADGAVHLEDSLERDKAGACAELAVSLAFGEKWDSRFIPVPKWDRVKRLIHDIGGKEVKSTEHRKGCLLVQKQFDAEPPYLLVLTHEAPVYHIVGWAYGHEVKKPEYWREDVKRPCYMMPQDRLRPIETLFGLEGKPMPQDEDDELADFMESFEAEAPPAAPVQQQATDVGSATMEDFMVMHGEKPPAPPAPTVSTAATDDGDDLNDYLEGMVVSTPKDMGLSKPWMKFHQFTLVKTVDEVRELVDRAIEHGQCGLDLETEGFDNRINYDAEGKPFTVHKIVGFCISVKGHGHYIPVRHNFDPVMAEKNPNVGPVSAVEAEIARLCRASQPTLTAEGMAEDPLGSPKIQTPGKLVIGFWHSKFDQEFLYPVTGIDFWHPESFEDGYLAAYSVYSDDDLGLKGKANERLWIEDPDRLIDGKPTREPYTMIEFNDLFPSGTKVKRFQDLYPEDGNAVTLYGCSDAICTEALCFPDKKQWAHTRDGLKYEYRNTVEAAKTGRYSFTYRLEKQATQAVRDMERRRAKIDKKAILTLLEEAKKELEAQEKLIVGLAEKRGFENFNPGSPQQLANFLFEKDGLDINPKPKKNEASGVYKTDAATLEMMAEANEAAPVLRWIVTYRQIEKIIGTYLQSMADNCDEQHQLRFKFNQTGATTGRFTAPSGEPDHGYSGIPIQGIPARDDPKKPKVAHSLRRIFIPRDGYTLLKVDYAGQELRIVANLSGESVWIDEFLHGTGDLHTITARAFFGPHITKENKVERNAGKIANFSLIYGGGVQAIMRATKCDKVEAARRKANFDKSVPTFASWVTGQHASVKRNKGVSTAFKRFIAIPDANVRGGDTDANGNVVTPEDAKKIQASCERKSTNFPIQGSGADIMKISLVKLVKEFHKRGWRREGGDDSVRMIMTVHDEIVFEIKHERLMEAVPVIIEIMESPSRMVGWKVPLVVEPLLGLSWEAKYDWAEIMHGEKPVPDWLVGILKPEKEYVPKELREAAPSPAAPAEAGPPPIATDAPPLEAEQLAKPASTPAPVVTTKNGVIKVAVFALSNTYLTNRSVDLVFEAVAGSLDAESHTYLRLVDNAGNVLIDPTHQRLRISAEKLKIKMQDRNLGSGEYELKEEPL